MQGTDAGVLVRGSVRTVVAACFVVGALGWAAPEAAGPQAAASQAAARPQPAAAPLAAINQYCVTCHNERAQDRRPRRSTVVDAARTSPPHAEVWEKVVRKLRAGAMPPQGVRAPGRRAPTTSSIALARSASSIAAPRPRRIPAGPSLHRLNRAEYANAIRDLLALDVDVGVAAAARRFGVRLRQHRRRPRRVAGRCSSAISSAAGRISALAVGDVETSARLRRRTASARISRRTSTSRACRSARVGGMLVRHTFPVDGEYSFQVKLFRTNSSVDARPRVPAASSRSPSTASGCSCATVGGGADFDGAGRRHDRRGRTTPVDARLQVRVPVKAGPRAVGVAFLQQTPARRTRGRCSRSCAARSTPTTSPGVRTSTP